MIHGVGELVRTDDGSLTVHHPLYGEEFHAKQGARTETQALYMNLSGFVQRLGEPGGSVGVLDVGLGLGYNAMATLEAWWRSEGRVDLSMLSLELMPELLQALIDPTCAWKEDWSTEWRQWSESLQRLHSGLWQASWQHPTGSARCFWQVQLGDASQLALEPAAFDYVWQDAFSPKKNGELWSAEWFSKLRLACRPGAALVTYSVARLVKDNLVDAGWSYEKSRAPHYKKQWLKATPSQSPRADLSTT